MIIATNFNDYQELGINEEALIDSIQTNWPTIKVPIFIYVDKRLTSAHGLHACRCIKDYKIIPKKVREVLMDEVLNNEDNKNHFHKISLSYEYLQMAKENKIGWQISDWFISDNEDIYQSYFSFVISHELQHANQIENGRQYKKGDWLEYKKFMYSDDLNEIDAELASILKYRNVLENYKKYNGGSF